MSDYTLTITRRVQNPHYATELEESKRRNMYEGTGFGPTPAQFYEEQVFVATVPEQTFAAIRKAALETL